MVSRDKAMEFADAVSMASGWDEEYNRLIAIESSSEYNDSDYVIGYDDDWIVVDTVEDRIIGSFVDYDDAIRFVEKYLV